MIQKWKKTTDFRNQEKNAKSMSLVWSEYS